MKEEQISTGYTVILQGIIVSFVVLLLIGIGFLLRNTTLDSTAWIVLCFIIAFIAIALWRLLSFADIYVFSEQMIIYKKIIGVRRRPLSEIRSVNEGILPFNYYIEFKDDKKVYFQLKPDDMLKRLISSDADSVLDSLKKRLNQR